MKIKTIVVVGLSSMAFMSASAEWITAEFVARVRPCFSSFLVKPRIDHGEIVAVSPDGRNKIRINLNPMSVEVIRDGKTVVAPGRISMKIDGCSLSEDPSILKPAVSTRRITGEVDAVMYKKRRVSLACVEKLADFGDWAIRMVARDDGVAYRFEIRRNGKVRVDGEHADFSVPDGSVRCWAHFTDRFGCEETIFRPPKSKEGMKIVTKRESFNRRTAAVCPIG